MKKKKKKQYFIATWNFNSMKQGKLEVVKQEMARVNIDILRISEPKWIGMGKFNSEGHSIYYCGQESLRKNGVTITVNKTVWKAVLGCKLKNDRRNSVHFQGKPFNIRIIQVYVQISNTEEAEVEWFYEDLQDLELTPQKDVLFTIREWNTKVGSQETPQVIGKIWPWSTEWSRAKANRVLPRNALVIANTFLQQQKKRLYTWTSPDGQHRNQIDDILCSQRWRSSIKSAKTRSNQSILKDISPEYSLEGLMLKLKLQYLAT